MKPQTMLSFVFKIIVLTILMFVLFMAGTALTGIGSDAGQSAPAEAGNSVLALLAVCLVDTLLLSYLIVRSRLHGVQLMVVAAVVYYGIKTFESQLESWYFMRNLTPEMLPKLFLMTVPIALIVPPVAVFLFGKAQAQSDAPLSIPVYGRWWKVPLLAAVVYPLLFFGFGYYIAWQNPDVRAFYGGTDPGSFFAQMTNMFSSDHFVYFFEILRGLMWVGLVALIIRSLNRGGWEMALVVGLMLALFENNMHWLPNPLMPPSVRATHFIETASENFIFGLIATGLLLWEPARQKIAASLKAAA